MPWWILTTRFLLTKQRFLSDTHHYLSCLHWEAIEIHKHKNCFNKKEESLRVKIKIIEIVRLLPIQWSQPWAVLRVKKSWYPALSVCKTKPYTLKDLNITQLDADQSESSRKYPDAGQSAATWQGDAPIYNTWFSPDRKFIWLPERPHRWCQNVKQKKIQL